MAYRGNQGLNLEKFGYKDCKLDKKYLNHALKQ